MFGLVLIGIFLIYLLVSAAVVVWAAKAAKKRQKSPKLWGGVAALLMYLLVFWDHIPTLVMHKYYCEKEAGLWVYKTPEQWVKEQSPIESAVRTNFSLTSETYSDGRGKRDIYVLNKYLNWIVSQEDISTWLPIIRSDLKVIDSRDQTVLAHHVDFSSGNSVKNTIGPPGPLKFWLVAKSCDGGQGQGGMYSFIQTIQGPK